MQALPHARSYGAELDAWRTVGIVPHVEDAGGAGSCRDCENCNGPKEWIEMTGCNGQSNNRGEHGRQR
jgi:hypothetical protein